MQPLISVVLAGLVRLGAAFTTPGHVGDSPCAVEQAPAALLAAHRELAAAEKHHLLRRNETTHTPPAIVVDVYVHVISMSETHFSHFSNNTIHEQIAFLNTYYKPGNISFVLKSASWTVNPQLSEGEDEQRMKLLHHKGDNRHLNIYYANHPRGPGIDASISSWPSDMVGTPLGIEMDGIMIAAIWLYTDKQVVVHEVGHWFGLMHTFANGCIGNGDEIDDTPAHAGPSRGCSAMPPLDTCPGEPGNDPVHNPMNYIPDSCMETFTPRQFERMRSFWTKYRSQPMQRPSYPTELQPIQPVDKGGSLPFYSGPVNPILAELRCFPDENGKIEER
ncbi:Peptidase M43, pregnancy-associated plasma-A [Metarhizium album ARSEF 1941]|uniref:Peptidase M43, pregnancy-associated plasma-A n=1 Tax=Metarhizium album (strain ARSEF 1941) TaxID=1081103 RepID=A0A0B2WLZ7_METAS|nr:Peptidase M43, pregnancy-associated plasma-A [Metarhizium album ARSEF 1941]KHN94040.1 Peptidase M43, pregnancy-associated plasma-A [Metarhizium album ARSEF 1941]